MNPYNFNDAHSQIIRLFSTYNNAKENNIPTQRTDSAISEMDCYEMEDRDSAPDRSNDSSFLTTSSPVLKPNLVYFPGINRYESSAGYPSSI
jgi:hypothetical protein